jgi:hypothetical protein
MIEKTRGGTATISDSLAVDIMEKLDHVLEIEDHSEGNEESKEDLKEFLQTRLSRLINLLYIMCICVSVSYLFCVIGDVEVVRWLPGWVSSE